MSKQKKLSDENLSQFVKLLKEALGPAYRVGIIPYLAPLSGFDLLVEFNIKNQKYFYKRTFSIRQKFERMIKELGLSKSAELIATDVLQEENSRKNSLYSLTP